MNRKGFIIIISAAAFFISGCSKSHSSKRVTGFNTVDFTLSTPLSTLKAYSFTDASINESCTASSTCSAVYVNRAVNNESYEAFAADSKLSGKSTSFNIMIYKAASQANYTITIKKDNILYTNTGVSTSTLNITPVADIYTLNFTATTSVGSLIIGSGDYITAQAQ